MAGAAVGNQHGIKCFGVFIPVVRKVKQLGIYTLAILQHVIKQAEFMQHAKA